LVGYYMNLSAASLCRTGMPGPVDTVVVIEIQITAVPGTGAGSNRRDTDGTGTAAPDIQTLQRGA
jgi:hypothetical protein